MITVGTCRVGTQKLGFIDPTSSTCSAAGDLVLRRGVAGEGEVHVEQDRVQVAGPCDADLNALTGIGSPVVEARTNAGRPRARIGEVVSLSRIIDDCSVRRIAVDVGRRRIASDQSDADAPVRNCRIKIPECAVNDRVPDAIGPAASPVVSAAGGPIEGGQSKDGPVPRTLPRRMREITLFVIRNSSAEHAEDNHEEQRGDDGELNSRRAPLAEGRSVEDPVGKRRFFHRYSSVGGHGQYTGAFPVVKGIGRIPSVHDCRGGTLKMNRLIRRSRDAGKRCHLGAANERA